MEQTRRLRDFMSVGAKAFVSPTGRSAAMAAAAVVGIAFSSVASASTVPVPTPRPEASSTAVAGPMTPLYAAVRGLEAAAPPIATAIPGLRGTSSENLREAFAARLSQASVAASRAAEAAKTIDAAKGTLEERGAKAGLNKVSLKLMAALHPDMQELLVRSRAASDVPFEVVPQYGGKRTAGMQAILKKRGVTKTLMSKHILGLAFDIAPKTANGRLDFADHDKLAKLAETVGAQAEALDLPITWGGSWKFVDKFHFELPADWEARKNAEPEPLVADNRRP